MTGSLAACEWHVYHMVSKHKCWHLSRFFNGLNRLLHKFCLLASIFSSNIFPMAKISHEVKVFTRLLYPALSCPSGLLSYKNVDSNWTGLRNHTSHQFFWNATP